LKHKETFVFPRQTNFNTYTLHGQLDTTTDAMGRTLDYDYTADGLLEKIIDPDGDYLFYAYDAIGRRIESSILSQND
jgi:YD repeat-containing protein